MHNQVQVLHPWNWIFSFYCDIASYLICLAKLVVSYQYILSMIHHLCVETEIYVIILIPNTHYLDFRFQDFKLFQEQCTGFGSKQLVTPCYNYILPI